MPAQTQSVSLVSLLAMPCNLPTGYYRSKLFTSISTTNPLLAGASPLLSLIERLTQSPNLPAIALIRDNIQHELFAFHGRLQGSLYNEEIIAIAHYFLSATIDELLGKNYLRLYDKPAEFQAFTPSANDGIGPEVRFFQLLEHIKCRVNQYLDLIELAYYCLIAGFEGEYHVRADGRQALDDMIEELYQLIQQHRVHKKNRLFKQKNIVAEPKKYTTLFNVSLISIGLMICSYFSSCLYLDYKAKSIVATHKFNIASEF